MADTATASPAPDTPQATAESLPEVTVSNTRLPTAPGDPGGVGPVAPGEQTVQPHPLSDMPGETSSPYISALGGIDPQVARVEQAIEGSPEEAQAEEFDRESARHQEKSAMWDRRAADLAQQYADWMQKAGPEMANYIENTPTRAGIYATNMHIAPLLAVVSAIGGKLTRASGLQMLAATTGAVQGLNQGNEQAYQDSMQKYKAGFDAFQKTVEMQNDYYNAMLKSYAGRSDAEEKAAAAAERMSGNIRTEEQKKLATAIQAKRANDTAQWQFGHLQNMNDALNLRREIAGLDFNRGARMGAQGLDAPLIAYSPMQILGMLSRNQIPLQGSRTTLAAEVQGIQQTTPNITMRQLINEMREKKLALREATVAIGVEARRAYPTAQAYYALTGDGTPQNPGIFSRLSASAAKVDFTSNKVIDELRVWKHGHVSVNPDLNAYMTDLEDARTELAVVMSRGGQMSDHARTWAEEALPAVTSKEGLNTSIHESTIIGERVLSGDERAMELTVRGGRLSDIYRQTSTGTGGRVDIGPQPPAGVRLAKPDAAGVYWRRFPNGYLQSEKTGEVVAPVIDPTTGKQTDQWRVISGPPKVQMGQGVGGANASMDYATEGGWGEYGDPQNQYWQGGGYYGGTGNDGYDRGYGGGPYPRGPNMPWTAASDLIKRYESRGGENVMNYMYASDPQHRTASGPYQLTATNFHEYGRRLGIDTSQWRYAMDAPEEIQEQIAETLYEEQGFAPWAPFNPQLARAINYG